MARKKSRPELYDEEPEEEIIYVSKSELKRDMKERQELGEKISKLSNVQREKLPLDDSLREAYTTLNRITSREARRRQLHYIGKLLRTDDYDNIKLAYDRLDAGHHEAQKIHHLLERWRDRLIEEGDNVLDEFLEEFPDAELQPLRLLIRQARKEAEHNKPPAASRKLYQHLKTLKA